MVSKSDDKFYHATAHPFCLTSSLVARAEDKNAGAGLEDDLSRIRDKSSSEAMHTYMNL